MGEAPEPPARIRSALGHPASPAGDLVPASGSTLEILQAWKIDLGDEPDLGALRKMRGQVDTVAFAARFRQEVRSANDPHRRAEAVQAVEDLIHRIGDLAADRGWQSGLIDALGLAGGGTMMGGALVAAATAPFSVLALGPALFGGALIWLGSSRSRRVRLESRALQDVETALRRLISDLPKEP